MKYPLILCLPLALACSAVTVDDAADENASTFVSPKSDGGCVDAGSDRAAGLLALVNDTAVSIDELDRPLDDGGAGLDRRAAQNIVAQRPFAGLGELDAVPYVGPATCRALVAYACEDKGLCGPDLKVVTWNIENFPLSGETIDTVAEAILDSGADVIGLQEISEPSAFFELLDQLPEYAGELAEPGLFTGVGIVFRTDRVTLTEVESMFTDDHMAFPRPPLRARFDVGGGSVSVVVVHLKAQVDSKSENRRRTACLALDEWMDDGGEDSVVVLGDWNDRLTDSDPSNVFQVFLDAPARYEFLTMPLAESGAFSYIPYESLIDHVLVTKSTLGGYRTVNTEIVRLDQSIPDYLDEVSDHLPIMATLSPR